MTDNQLFTDAIHHIAKGEHALFLFNARVKDHLQQYVSQFFLQGGGILVVDGFQRLVGFLQEIGPDALMSLLPIPWTAIRRAQQLHNLQQVVHRIMILVRKRNSHWRTLVDIVMAALFNRVVGQ